MAKKKAKKKKAAKKRKSKRLENDLKTLMKDQGICQIIYRLSQTSSKLQKVEIARKIKGDEIAEHVVYHALNPYWTYGVLPAECDDITDADHAHTLDASLRELWPDLRQLLNEMISRNVTGNEARQALKKFNAIAPIVQRILSKDFRCGAHITTFNEALGNRWLPTFDVALADEGFVIIDGNIDKGVDISYPIWAEPKYDGIRVIAVYDEGTVQLFSRKGKEFTNFPKIQTAIHNHEQFQGLMLDGEVFGATFDDATTVAHRKDGKDDSDLTFCVWDCMHAREFAASNCQRTLVDRQKMLSGAICGCDPKVHQAPGCLIQNEQHMLATFHAIREQGYEGLVLKPLDSLYSYKRSRAWIKVKEMYAQEFTAIGFEQGKGKHAKVLGALKVEGNGLHAEVGSGFTDEQRAEIWKNRESYQGRLAEVKYQEVTDDKSLRFPVFLRWRPDAEEDDPCPI